MISTTSPVSRSTPVVASMIVNGFSSFEAIRRGNEIGFSGSAKVFGQIYFFYASKALHPVVANVHLPRFETFTGKNVRGKAVVALEELGDAAHAAIQQFICEVITSESAVTRGEIHETDTN